MNTATKTDRPGHELWPVCVITCAAAITRRFCCLRISRGLVASKARNCEPLLRQNPRRSSATWSSGIEQLARKAGGAASMR